MEVYLEPNLIPERIDTASALRKLTARVSQKLFIARGATSTKLIVSMYVKVKEASSARDELIAPYTRSRFA